MLKDRGGADRWTECFLNLSRREKKILRSGGSLPHEGRGDDGDEDDEEEGEEAGCGSEDLGNISGVSRLGGRMGRRMDEC